MKAYNANPPSHVADEELCEDSGPRVENAVESSDPGARVNGSVAGGEDTMPLRVMSAEHLLAVWVCRAGQLRWPQSEYCNSLP